MQEESKEKSKDASFESLRILSERWKNGTFSEIIDDWKWIFGYSARYKGAIVFYTILGILSTSLGLVGSVAGKYLSPIACRYPPTGFFMCKDIHGCCGILFTSFPQSVILVWNLQQETEGTLS